MRRVTAKMLKDLGACKQEVEVFTREWPHGAAVTLANCRRAAVLKLNLTWAAERLLSPSAYVTYKVDIVLAWAPYEAALASTWAAYNTARAAYDAARADAFYRAATRR
jgi:hypothetical protein